MGERIDAGDAGVNHLAQGDLVLVATTPLAPFAGDGYAGAYAAMGVVVRSCEPHPAGTEGRQIVYVLLSNPTPGPWAYWADKLRLVSRRRSGGG